MKHIVLLGDSIFDNGAYVNGGPDVVTRLKPIKLGAATRFSERECHAWVTVFRRRRCFCRW
jgi:hypothetical protein